MQPKLKKRRRPFVLGKLESIVTAYAESAAGPGWVNTPLWVIVMGQGGSGFTLRQECIQPEDQTTGMRTLYGASAAVSAEMRSEVIYLLKGKR